GIEPIGVTVGDSIEELIARSDAILDFTAPAVSVDLARRLVETKVTHILGTTGCTAEDDAAVEAAAAAGARIGRSGNFSRGLNLLAALVKKAAQTLDAEFDIEIVEMHHRHKVDAPSGTALILGDAAAEGRGIDLAKNSVRVRDGHTGAREPGSIGFATLRGGG